MKAVVLHAAGDLRLQEVPDPDPGPGELLLRVETVGICGTDVAEYLSGPHQFPLLSSHPVTGHVGPMIPGHELSGRVEALGAGVGGFSIGDLVASAGSSACGECRWCAAGRPSRCPGYWAVGLHRDGAMAEYCTVPASACLVVDSTPDEAVLAQPMSIAVHAMRRGGITGGESVVVVGAGGVGAFLTYAAASSGCPVTTVDIDPTRLQIASALGAATRLPEEGVPEIEPAAVVFEVTGTEAGLHTALSALAPGGRLVAIGFQKHPVEIDLAAVTTHELEVVGTNRIDPARDPPEAVRLLASRPEPWTDVAPTVRPLEEVESVLRSIGSGTRGPIKPLFSPRITRARPSRGRPT